MTAPKLPATAPFQPQEIDALNAVISRSSPDQRAWLSGFLAGYAAATDGSALQAAAPAAAAKPKVPLTILYATESGNSEALADQVRKDAAKQGFKPTIVDMAEADWAELSGAENLLVLAATWGEGDPPERAAEAYHALFAEEAPRFENTRFSVLALGDRSYPEFCAVGRKLDERLEALGGTRIAERVECDVDFEDPAARWMKSALDNLVKETGLGGEAPGSVIHVDFAGGEAGVSAYSKANPFPAEILERAVLTSSRSTKTTFHIELGLEGSGLTYQPGDALGIVPTNDPAVAVALAEAAGLGGDTALIEKLTTSHDLATLSAHAIQTYAELVGDSTIAAKADDAAYLAANHLVDFLRDHPAELSAAQLTGWLRPLQPRLYSIASAMEEVGEQADLLIAALRYELNGEQRGGVASLDLLERRKKGGEVPVYIKPNKHFRLPADGDTPIIMIGPGTGVAPYRGFLQARRAAGAAGKSWLFFGEQHYTHSFLYQLDWQDFMKDGALTKLDVAFSRDQPEKVYVQHRLWQRRAEVDAWLREGAHLYICGDEKQMAKDVQATLIDIIAEQRGLEREAAEAELNALRKDGRYQKDVY